ncbi:MAG: lytic transglycosylase domain-containing protein [Alphaproteobacteria bacterium PRO2]|nr:lytic transglycosylase domain-containing protein [Alphaproteobacteria bacterium PRO2]
MQGTNITNIARLGAAVLALGCVSGPVMARTDGVVPVPPAKPARQKAAPAETPAAAEPSTVQDFARNLLGLKEVAPVAAEKPAPRKAPEPVIYPDEAMSDADARTYQAIFKYQEEGKMEAADRQIARLHDRRLMGHVLYQRYMHPDYKSGFDELHDWLVIYSDHPGAEKIYRMANGRMPEAFDGRIAKPADAEIIGPHLEPTMIVGKTYASPRKRSGEELKTVEKTRNEILTLANDYKATAALSKLQSNIKLFDSVEYDQIQSKIAAAYLYSGNAKRAGELAAASLKRSGQYAPMAGWVAGLAAWENGQYKKSAAAFEVPARSDYASGWTAAAASYWAARAHMRAGNVRVVSKWLKAGMEHPRTFYGLIATRSLGRDFDFNWKVPTFTKNYFDVLMKTHPGNRAIALVAAGQPHLAESELIRMKPEDDNMRDALLAYAGYADLPSLGMRLASLVSDEAGAYYDAALYPTGPWKPAAGYKIDPALIYAITRQESKFDPMAKSSAGAVGLMQVLPSTASSIVDDPSLTNPQENLEVAQRYLENLLKDKSVQGDMVMLLIAYNAGPGNLAKWKKQWPEVKDPLLFIELIPSSETRSYVERVLANYWIYCLRDGQPTPTLDALATGKIAKYAEQVAEQKGPYETALAQ